MLAHLQALAGLRAELIPADATRIVSHLFLLAFSRLGGLTRLVHFCGLGALVALAVHGHDNKAMYTETLGDPRRIPTIKPILRQILAITPKQLQLSWRVVIKKQDRRKSRPFFFWSLIDKGRE